MEKKEKKKTNLTKTSLILRVMVSLYLLYTVYQLWGSVATTVGRDKIIVIAAMVIFTGISIPLGGFSIRALSQGNYRQQNEEETKEEIVEELKENQKEDEEDTK